ncbi:hypothetical protein INR49_032339 [Caranx melampygus]|nr:hypothetical protein INR49_032339 [Caranx melampygus]
MTGAPEDEEEEEEEEEMDWQWVFLTGDHDDSVASGNGCPKKCYHGEEGVLIWEDEPHDSQGVREGESRARLWHRLAERKHIHQCPVSFTGQANALHPRHTQLETSHDPLQHALLHTQHPLDLRGSLYHSVYGAVNVR